MRGQDSGLRLEPARQPEGQEGSPEAACVAAAGLINSICWQGVASSPSQVRKLRVQGLGFRAPQIAPILGHLAGLSWSGAGSTGPSYCSLSTGYSSMGKGCAVQPRDRGALAPSEVKAACGAARLPCKCVGCLSR